MQGVTGTGDVISTDMLGNVKCDLANFSQKGKFNSKFVSSKQVILFR